MKDFQAVLAAALLCLPSGARAADYYAASADSGAVAVDFPAQDLAELDAGTMTVVASSGSGTYVLDSLVQVCAPSCAGAGEACFARGLYAAPIPASGGLFAFPGRLDVSDLKTVAMAPSSSAPQAVVREWSSQDEQDGVSLSPGAASGGDSGVHGRWDWDADSGSADFQASSEDDSVVVSSAELSACRVLEGEGFKSLDCPGTQADGERMFGWLYYQDRFIARYTCADCSLPDLRVSGTFQLDGDAHYVLATGKRVWVLQDTEAGFLPLKGVEDLVPDCH